MPDTMLTTSYELFLLIFTMLMRLLVLGVVILPYLAFCNKEMKALKELVDSLPKSQSLDPNPGNLIP